MLSASQKDNVITLLREVGETTILPYLRNLQESDVSFKSSPDDPVSVADREAEARLQKGLTAILPGSLFIGEELFDADPGILAHLEDTDRPIWVVDPIDGTRNFVSGHEGFGIMVCLLSHGQIKASWLYEPCTKKLTVFLEDEVTLNGAPALDVSAPQKPYKGLVGWKLYKKLNLEQANDALHTLDIDPAKSPSIISYSRVLAGELDFLIYKITYPWDHLPGMGVLSQTQAVFTRWDGTPFQLSDIDKGLIVARTPDVLSEVLTHIIAPLQDMLATPKFGT